MSRTEAAAIPAAVMNGTAMIVNRMVVPFSVWMLDILSTRAGLTRKRPHRQCI